MSTWQQKEGSGSLFSNDKKGNEKAPAWRGDIMLGGITYELAGWVKQTKTGNNFLSLAGKVKEERQSAPAKQPPASGGADIDGDIPFNKLGKHAY